MLAYLKDIVDYDALFFMPVQNNDDDIHIQSNRYKNPGNPVGGNSFGPEWHVILFKCGEESLEHLDTFDAIFADPREYISTLIPQGWYGVVARKTTTSKTFLDDAIAKFKSV